MKRTLLALPLLAGCPRDLPEDRACAEAGYAIAARSEQCTGDTEIADALYEQFDTEVICTLDQLPPDSPLVLDKTLPYECSLVTRNLACELAIEYGTDLEAWLKSSPVCRAILEGP